MKRLCYIGVLLVGLVLAMACNPKGSALKPAGVPSRALSAIDSLMWRQPDSAFAQLLQLAETTDTDSFDAFDRHYFQLLVSELLYKNDYAQSNRTELRQAVSYFDSLANLRPPFKGVRGIQKAVSFLDARAHYINGVGYYENDSIVEACAEYLKALEIMEDHFEEKELVGRKAQFMAYTYNRLGDLFSDQFMMEPSIACYDKYLLYNNIEPTSKYGVSKTMSHIGMQYDMKGEKTHAMDYYKQALESLPDTNNLTYRDIVSIMALCDYQLGLETKKTLKTLKRMVSSANDESERLTRYFTIGDLFYEEGLYDSALFYLEPVLEGSQDILSKAQAAHFLRLIYDSIGDLKKSDECMRYLAVCNSSGAEDKALVSRLEDLFETYLNQKQERQVMEERKTTVRNVVGTMIPLVFVACLSIIAVTRKKMKKQRQEADRKWKKSEQEHRQKMEEIVKRHGEEMRAKDKSALNETEKKRAYIESHYEAFLNEPVCRRIIDSVGDLTLSARSKYSDYLNIALDEATSVALGKAIAIHFPDFKLQLSTLLPKADQKDLQICYLLLLGMNNQQIAVLQQRHNSTIHRRTDKMQKDLGTQLPLSEFVRNLAYGQA